MFYKDRIPFFLQKALKKIEEFSHAVLSFSLIHPEKVNFIFSGDI